MPNFHSSNHAIAITPEVLDAVIAHNRHGIDSSMESALLLVAVEAKQSVARLQQLLGAVNEDTLAAIRRIEAGQASGVSGVLRHSAELSAVSGALDAQLRQLRSIATLGDIDLRRFVK